MSDYISKSALIEALEKVHPRVNGIDVFWSAMKVVENQPTVDEKEIIRKAFERVVERLEEQKSFYENHPHNLFNKCDEKLGRVYGFNKSIEIIKEECGISE